MSARKIFHIDVDIGDREPSSAELAAIEAEYQYGASRFPIETDLEKPLSEWTQLICAYAGAALRAYDTTSIHERYIQAAQLCIRAARAVRTGQYAPEEETSDAR
jgi:hypothetical protein